MYSIIIQEFGILNYTDSWLRNTQSGCVQMHYKISMTNYSIHCQLKCVFLIA